MIPISISTSKHPGKEVVSTVLKEKKADILVSLLNCVKVTNFSMELFKVPGATETDWIKVNPGTIGFYRTKYPSEMLEKFVPAIRDKTLPPLDR